MNTIKSKTDENTKKWIWMMDYCKKHTMPPAQKWAWNIAEKAYVKVCENLKIGENSI